MDIKVLLADNEKNIREVIKYGLSVKGIFNIEEASDGMKAVMKAMLLKPDIILLDVNMPVMDGIQAYKKLKEEPDTRDIPVILFTAKSYADLLKEVKITPDEYFEKPGDIEELYVRIKKITGKGRCQK